MLVYKPFMVSELEIPESGANLNHRTSLLPVNLYAIKGYMLVADRGVDFYSSAATGESRDGIKAAFVTGTWLANAKAVH